MTIDLDPLNDAITDNAAGVGKNASDILGLKATDAKHTGQIADLETAVGHLEAIDIPDNYAVVDDDNEFQVPQTIKDGVKLTGADAFIECDTGTPLQVKNSNFSNSVVDIIRTMVMWPSALKHLAIRNWLDQQTRPVPSMLSLYGFGGRQ